MGADGRTPFTIDELLRFWRGIVDVSYAQPFFEALDRLGSGISIDAGEDDDPGLDQPTRGLEIFTQQMAQAKRMSEAVIRNYEAMFILGWSGQADLPALGEERSIVTLTFNRTRRFDTLITFPLGITVVQEIERDAAPDGGIDREVGRFYLLLQSVTFLPGESGPKTVQAIAEKPGFGYNNPRTGTIKQIEQRGIGLSNIDGTVIPGPNTHQLQVSVDPDVITPQNVGQYIEFLVGANAGKIVRMVGYRAPDTTVPHGGIAILARTTLLRVSAVVGSPVVGEVVEQATTSATGTFVTVDNGQLVVEGSDSLWAATFTATGVESGFTFLVDKVEQDSSLVAESASAAWRVLGIAGELGFTVSNLESPTGGRAAMLDSLGRERDIDRAPGEIDNLYRKRIHQLPDTVSPNAIRRTVNRILAQVGAGVCLRDTGLELLPGFYADVDAADYDFVVRPQDQYKVVLNYEEFRAFFLVGVPRLSLGEFGFFYDDGPFGFYDAAPFNAFYDGFPLEAAIIYRNIWDAVNKARAGGVGFALVIEDGGCF